MPFPRPTDETDLKWDDLPVGTRVKVVSKIVDFYFFYGETGKVINNFGRYLGVIVEFDKPRVFKDGYVQRKFNFNPENLEIIQSQEKQLNLLWDGGNHENETNN